MATGTLSKRMTAAFAMSVNDIKMTYARQKADIDKSLRFSPGVYDASIAMVYAFLKMPESVIKRTMGTIPGMAFSFMYSAYVAPVKVVLNVLDLRTLKGFFATIIYFVKDCVPKLLSTLLTKMFQVLADIFKAFAKSLTSVKKINNLKGRQMLTESKAYLLEGKIWDWFKSKVTAIVNKVKGAMWTIVKTGLAAIEKPFLDVVYPITKCMAKSNKTRGASLGTALSGKNETINKLGSAMGITGAVTATLGTGGLAALASFGWLMGMVALVFGYVTYVNYIGEFLEFKNMIVDVFS